ncbi:hypothetical protein GOP47_0004466 [Adiantum capillus-veneris]|uniref:RNA-dependent RNA polymerase n=1 Tax=Adiantum capillus-veneris TaxID=13818 RepID=A0A9D4V7X8_ADICA|nr:hypothetical protein GOP47_0003750 [Adiantum capillus-veneris]KAI5081283.1 hypothetical protein GOP47_0004466 [Adiantum capillus-veneris]
MTISCTVRVSKIPFTAIAEELVEFLESSIGSNTVFACKIHTEKPNWKSKGFGFVQFEAETAAIEAVELARKCKLRFQQRVLQIDFEPRQLFDRPQIRFHAISLHMGWLATKSEFHSLWSANLLVTIALDCTKGKLVLVFDKTSISTRYKLTWNLRSLEIGGTQNEIGQSSRTFLLLQAKFAPKIRRKLKLNSLKRGKESVSDRFTFVRDNSEDQEHLWCRCADFTEKGCIAQSSSYYLEISAAEKHLYQVFTDTLLNVHAFEEFGDIAINPGECNSQTQDKCLRKLAVSKLDEGLIQMNRLIVTPTKEYFVGPETEVSNRVTRHYKDNIGNFIRVHFADEDMSSLSARILEIASDRFLETRVRPERTEIYYRIRKILDQGIRFGGKMYEFLAFSSSQLREHSVWMFASDQTTTCDGIRSWMGDFSKFRNVASCAARMGQCFSASKQGPDVYEDEIEEIPDIERWSGGVKYCFSDGIGKISPVFGAEVAMKCGYESTRQEVLAPSAFQIRYGGYKGVVAIDPSSSHKLSLRPSMKKFHSNHSTLDVLEWSRFLPCYLNRQVISLLSTLGVEDQVFEVLQRERISSLDGVMTDREDALQMLQTSCAGDYCNVTVQMLLCGYNPSDEPFLFSMMWAFRSAQIQQICKKSKIFVPKGRILMGCLDEYGCLNYGQVFVKVSSLDGTASVIKGTVVITKNPCLHPGDIRVLQAVDSHSLQHMVDCVVFPQKGTRPHPNECSGSDLDGDLYFVAWDERLVPPTVEVPMEYYAPNSIALDHPPTLEEIHTYFVDYMSNDSLGTIANAHVVFADQEPEKARSQKCLKLAELASIAVDFPKTGVSAMLPRSLRPQAYPDFMEKIGKKSYISSGVIGKLYRAAKEAISANTLLRSAKESTGHYDPDLVVNGFEDHVERALVYKSLYYEKLTALMEFYGVQNEAEMLTGFFSELRQTFSNTSKEVEERIQNAVLALKGEAKSWFKDMQNTDDPSQEYAIASAWYHVTYHPTFHHEEGPASNDKACLLSFPWVNYDKLLEIKRYMKLFRNRSCNDP